MAVSISTDINTYSHLENLESLIGKISFSHKELCASYLIGNHSKIEHKSDITIIHNDYYYSSNFHKSPIVTSNPGRRIVIFRERDDLEIEITKDKINVYKRKYICPLSKKMVDGNELFSVSIGYALTKFVVLPNTHHNSNKKLQPVPYIYCGSPFAIKFIFDIMDTRDSYPQGIDCIKEIGNLPQTALDRIAFYLGCDKTKENYIPTDFPSSFYSKYKGSVPKKFSQAQLEKLFKLGIVNPAYGDEKMMLSVSDEACDFYTHVSDKTFYFHALESDDIEDNRFSTWRITHHFNNLCMQRFRNKKDRLEWRDKCLKTIFTTHPLADLL